jgi:hypothetical protein
MTVPTEDETSSGILAVGTSYYEFIPEARIEERDPPVMLAHQLERGQRYYIVISGQNGLYGKREAQYKWRQLAQEWDAISIPEVISTAPNGGQGDLAKENGSSATC